jgi:hypothetical protein
MDYKYIEQLLERYFNAETSLEEESILRSFFSQEDTLTADGQRVSPIPAELQQWRALFTCEAAGTLGDDFDARMLAAIEDDNEAAAATTAVAGSPVVKEAPTAQRVTLTQRLMPLFRAAAVVAILLTIGGALQAPWDNSWNEPVDMASYQHELDSVEAVSPVQAENISDAVADSTKVLLPALPKD